MEDKDSLQNIQGIALGSDAKKTLELIMISHLNKEK
tara:strand:+ start:319 stop:426 length:108 start_codon:yes stop_codon:yes gene_type:complete